MTAPDVFAISLWQPWASLVPLGLKRVETRSWGTDHRGPLVIHAAKTLAAVPARSTITIGDVDVERDRAGLLLRGAGWPYRLPLGAYVAHTRLVAVVPTEQVEIVESPGSPYLRADGVLFISAREAQYGDYRPGRHAWLLADVQRIAEPIPARGRQGLWRPTRPEFALLPRPTGRP